MSPGNELIDKKELGEIKEIFSKSDGVLFAHGFDKRRKNIFRVRNFEKKLSKKFNSKYVQCVSSGTAAIKIALKALGVKHGDEVITQSFNFIATIEAILDCGAKPIITGINDACILVIAILNSLPTNDAFCPNSSSLLVASVPIVSFIFCIAALKAACFP